MSALTDVAKQALEPKVGEKSLATENSAGVYALRDAAQQALAVIHDTAYGAAVYRKEVRDVIAALRAALEQQDAPVEPAGWFEGPFGKFRANQIYKISWPASTVAWSIPLYTSPPQRPAEPVQEPVAWRIRAVGVTTGDRGPWRIYWQSAKPGVNRPECCEFEALYTHPPIDAEREAK